MVFILNYLFALSTKDFIKGLPEGTQGFYFLLILLATTKAGKDKHTRMFQKPAVGTTEAIIEYPPPLPLPPPYRLDGVKLAEHVLLSFMFISHVGFLPQAEQSPPHPTKVWRAAGVAISVTVP